MPPHSLPSPPRAPPGYSSPRLSSSPSPPLPDSILVLLQLHTAKRITPRGRLSPPHFSRALRPVPSSRIAAPRRARHIRTKAHDMCACPPRSCAKGDASERCHGFPFLVPASPRSRASWSWEGYRVHPSPRAPSALRHSPRCTMHDQRKAYSLPGHGQLCAPVRLSAHDKPSSTATCDLRRADRYPPFALWTAFSHADSDVARASSASRYR
ncbi:hypothetical protein K438DRAFT_1972993 [Mycena galopus ATCC 62051]|nr:hypothetical protein K438DRAFT_1972993 [Mycena galopus ATCC 62051]